MMARAATFTQDTKTGVYPPFISILRDDAGNVLITVRELQMSRKHCQQATIALTGDQWAELMEKVN